MLGALLPPGKVWRLVGGVLSDVLAGCAIELERLHARVDDLLNEADPSTADELLPEYERELDIASEGTDDERRGRVVGRHVARQRFRPEDFQVALAQALGQAAEDVVIIERTAATAAAMGDAREIFRFFVYRDPDLPGAYDIAGAQELIDDIKPVHTAGHAIESIDFLCDDPYSLCDRDLLGA
jgi:uncharacterized protein YmfQ (DUF2313 family)